jgi:hypothetical protein
MLKECQYKNFVRKEEGTQNLDLMHVIKGKAYLTDGHRALIRDTELKTGAYTLEDIRFADIKTPKNLTDIYPKKRAHIKVKTTVPLMFGSLKNGKHTKGLRVYVGKSGAWTFLPSNDDDTLASFNPLYFAEIAGQEIVIEFSKRASSLNPAYVFSKDRTQVLVVMPMRYSPKEGN